MKKFLGILVLVFLLNGCDDGDVTVNIIDFDGSDVGACGLLAYKLTENRALIIKVLNNNDPNAFTNAFANDATPADAPRILEIPSKATVTYRAYNGDISSDVLCSNPPPISPIAVEEWTATTGSVEITTTQINNAPNTETGRITINKYQHSIVLKNMKYLKPDGTNQEEPFRALGNYSTTPTTLPLNFNPDQAKICSATNTIYSALNAGKEGLFIKQYDAELLSTAQADLGVAKTRTIGTTQNSVTYRLFVTPLPADGNDVYFCSATASATPAIQEEWKAVSGTISVTTTTFNTEGTVFQHTIRLQGVTFKKGNSTFYYGDDILYGVITQ